MKKIGKISLTIVLIFISLIHTNVQKRANMENTALLIIDIQNDYFKGGKMELAGYEAAGNNTKQVLEYFRSHHLPVIHIKHIAMQEGATFFLPNTSGAEINIVVSPKENEKIITKNYPNSFRETELLSYLQFQGIKNLIITGMMTDVCVDSTVRAAMDFGFNNTVIGDAVATKDRELFGEAVKAADINRSYLAGMSALGNLYAKVLTTNEFLKQ